MRTKKWTNRWKTVAAGIVAGLLIAPLLGAMPAHAALKAKSAPTAIVDNDGRIWLFVTDQTTGNVYFRTVMGTIPAPSFTPWQNLGGVNAGNVVAAVVAVNNRVVIFVRGTDNKIYNNWESASGSLTFNGWSVLWGSTTFATDPVVTTLSDGRMQVFAATSSDTVYNSWQSTPTGSFQTQWSSLGTVDITPSSGPDLAVAKSPGGRLVLTAGYKYRNQPAAGGTWSAWQDINPNQPISQRIDHVALRATSNYLYGVGLHWQDCTANCEIRAKRWNDSTLAFEYEWWPGGNEGAAQMSPIALSSNGTALQVAVKGTDTNIHFNAAGQCYGLACNRGWQNAGAPSVVSPPALATAPVVTYIFTSVYGAATYYQLFWNDTYQLSGMWIALT